MSTRITTRHHTTHSVSIDDHVFETEFAPVDESCVLYHIQGDKAVIAYLVQDDTGMGNPMQEYDCQGTLYTRSPHWARDSRITDDDESLRRALCLDGSYGTPDWETKLTLNGETKELGEWAALQVYEDFELDEVPARLLLLHHRGYLDLYEDDYLELDNSPSDERLPQIKVRYQEALLADFEDPTGFSSDEVDKVVAALYKEHWRSIVPTHVIPISYSRGQETFIGPDRWDGDFDELPDGVWVGDNCEPTILPRGAKLGQVKGDDGRYTSEYEITLDGELVHTGTLGACKDAVEAIRPVTHDDEIAAYTKYAESVLDEYANWCNGYVYGCVVETYTLVDGEWQSDGDHDSCWGFIGDKYAERALREEYFDPAVKRLQDADPALNGDTPVNPATV